MTKSDSAKIPISFIFIGSHFTLPARKQDSDTLTNGNTDLYMNGNASAAMPTNQNQVLARTNNSYKISTVIGPIVVYSEFHYLLKSG